MTTLARTAWGLDVGPDDQVWRQKANCSPAVADWFWFTGHHVGRGGHTFTDDNRAAVELCRTCPVIDDCLRYELAHRTPWTYIAAGRLWPDGRQL
jgi:hypothetical protein